MSALLIKLLPYLVPLGKALVAAILTALTELVTGRAIRRLILWPFKYWANRTKNKKDDQLIRDAEQDLRLNPEKEE